MMTEEMMKQMPHMMGNGMRLAMMGNPLAQGAMMAATGFAAGRGLFGFAPAAQSAGAAGGRPGRRLSAAQVREGNRPGRFQGHRHGQGLRAAPEGEPRRPGRRSAGERSPAGPADARHPRCLRPSNHGCGPPVTSRHRPPQGAGALAARTAARAWRSGRAARTWSRAARPGRRLSGRLRTEPVACRSASTRIFAVCRTWPDACAGCSTACPPKPKPPPLTQASRRRSPTRWPAPGRPWNAARGKSATESMGCCDKLREPGGAPAGTLQARLQPILKGALTEKAAVNFLNDVLMFYLIQVHWDLITKQLDEESGAPRRRLADHLLSGLPAGALSQVAEVKHARVVHRLARRLRLIVRRRWSSSRSAATSWKSCCASTRRSATCAPCRTSAR